MKDIWHLPDHWEIFKETNVNFFCDDGRDYDKPMYIRKDGLVRIYHNDGEAGKYKFGIVWLDGDGDCRETLEEAIKIADNKINDKV